VLRLTPFLAERARFDLEDRGDDAVGRAVARRMAEDLDVIDRDLLRQASVPESRAGHGIGIGVKIKTIKNTNREIDKFLMIIFSNEPDVLFTHLVELE